MKSLHDRLSFLLKKAIRDYRLIDDGDKVLVALSGGKDSLCLLQLLAERQRIFMPKFTLEAVHVRMRNIPYESDTSYLENFASELGVRLHVVETAFEQRPGSKKPACFLCSWYRRKELFRLAQEGGFNKIALGHHQDDMVRTALMNLTFHGQFATMPARLTMKKMPLTIIRPLCLMQEEDIRRFSTDNNYQKQKKLCPHERETNRTEIGSLVDMMERLNSDAKKSVWNSLERAGLLTEES